MPYNLDMDKTAHPDAKIIDALGGTNAVARIFDIKAPSVSDWKKSGIPRSRKMYLEAVYPEVINAVAPGATT